MYQRKTRKYTLPTAVYNATVWQIRDYYRLKEAFDGADDKSIMVDVKTVIDGIDNAMEHIPEEYRKGVWDNIMFQSAYPLDASRATYGRHKSAFIFEVAEIFHFL